MDEDVKQLVKAFSEAIERLEQSDGEKKKKVETNNRITGISVLLTIIVTGVSILSLMAAPFIEFREWRTNTKYLMQYMRRYHPECQIENGGFMPNPYNERGGPVVTMDPYTQKPKGLTYYVPFKPIK